MRTNEHGVFGSHTHTNMMHAEQSQTQNLHSIYIYLFESSVMTGGTDKLKILDATYMHAPRNKRTTLNCIATYHGGQHDFDEA